MPQARAGCAVLPRKRDLKLATLFGWLPDRSERTYLRDSRWRSLMTPDSASAWNQDRTDSGPPQDGRTTHAFPGLYFPVSAFQRIFSISRNIKVPSRKGLMRVPSL